MKVVNVYFKSVLQNTFVTVTEDFTKKVIWIQSLGRLSFHNKQKSLFEAFRLIIANAFNYILNNNLQIKCLYLNRVPKMKIKLINKYFGELNIQKIKLIQKISHNGCRSKKLKHLRSKKLWKNKFKL